MSSVFSLNFSLQLNMDVARNRVEAGHVRDEVEERT